jgi:hypothetical protein
MPGRREAGLHSRVHAELRAKAAALWKVLGRLRSGRLNRRIS